MWRRVVFLLHLSVFFTCYLRDGFFVVFLENSVCRCCYFSVAFNEILWHRTKIVEFDFHTGRRVFVLFVRPSRRERCVWLDWLTHGLVDLAAGFRMCLHRDFACPESDFQVNYKLYTWKFVKLTKCAPCCTNVCARLAGQGCANAAKCRGVFPASSIEFGSAPTVNRAFTSCGDGNWHAG